MNKHHKQQAELGEELKIINQAKADPDKFELLNNKYYNNIFRFIYNRTSNKDLTSDIASNVFLKAMLQLKKYVFKGVPFSAWLFKIALNEINQFYRKSKQTRTISINETSIGEVVEIIMDENAEEKQELLFAALGVLSDSSMQLIEMRFFEKRSFKEIGDILNITENNAKVKVYLTIDKLKERIKKQKSKNTTVAKLSVLILTLIVNILTIYVTLWDCFRS